MLKHRRRRERAERRLAATEENLDRLGDLLREVKRQIRPLERQAAAARSHASLVDELRALRLYLVGQELGSLEARRQEATTRSAALHDRETGLVGAITELDDAAETTAAELAAQHEEDVVVALTACRGSSSAAAGCTAWWPSGGGPSPTTSRRRPTPTWCPRSRPTRPGSWPSSRRPGATTPPWHRRRTRSAPPSRPWRTTWPSTRRPSPTRPGCAPPRRPTPSPTASSSPCSRALDHDRGGLVRADEQLAATAERRSALEAEAEELRGQIAALEESRPATSAHADEARAGREAATAALRGAEEALRQAERRQNRLEARAEALARRAAEERGSAGTDVLGDMAGVLGTLADLVEVDDGWSAAFEAAAAGALRAVVVDGTETGRAVLDALHRHDTPGTVLLASTLAPDTAPWSSFADPGPDAPAGGDMLRRHLHARVPSVGPLLDRIFGSVVGVRGGWAPALDVALARPDALVVSTEGDHFSPQGWRVRAAGPGLAALAHQAAEEAEAAAAEAVLAAGEVERAHDAATRATAEAGDAARQLERAVDRYQGLVGTRDRLASELRSAHEEWAEAGRHRQGLAERLERQSAQLAALQERLPRLEAEAAAAAGRLAVADEARRRLEGRRSQVAVQRRDLEVKVAGLAERRAVLTARLEDTERRLAGHVEERHRAGERRRRLEAAAQATERLGGAVDVQATRLAALLDRLRQQRSRQLDDVRAAGERLESLRKRRAEADVELAGTRQEMQRLELELAESAVRAEAAVEALRRELGCEPEEAVGAPCPELPEGEDPARRAAAVDKELQSMGPVNPLALEELGTLEERHRFLEEQVEDVRRARRELHQVIRAVDDEIIRVFAQAFADVNEHFQVLVSTLFPGGSGRLTLTDPTDLLETGVEVEARPAGKNVRKLSLLSGGERSLVALAFLFAVFRSRPSPFYLLDEVEAALDDVNLHRFLDLLHEFREEAQLIIVSHQKRTMEAADALYGVTMTPGGSSKVISQKVRRDSADAEPTPSPV